ncbi:hypothetical protein GN244_ATG15604 [Phytophthora infestans]|uniref:FLZ-type domain-containing protein n=1 Tax=Phytophthora infestans TaxID=4787 RepID=A0A833S4E3_PHYIN|nr:hypothetical protein GN244_ATG15604 [Phytophthora infestans]
MNLATPITSNQISSSPCAMTSETKARCTQELRSPPNFASRMFRLVFKPKQRSANQRAKSWPGCAEFAAVRGQSSTSIEIPSSVPPWVPRAHIKLQQDCKQTADDSNSEASWRERQVRCTNCERLFFKSMAMPSSTADRFCSLDCKANYEYLSQLQDTIDVGMLGAGGTSCAYSDYSSDIDGALWF